VTPEAEAKCERKERDEREEEGKAREGQAIEGKGGKRERVRKKGQ
jgi:hypothetical protein